MQNTVVSRPQNRQWLHPENCRKSALSTAAGVLLGVEWLRFVTALRVSVNDGESTADTDFTNKITNAF